MVGRRAARRTRTAAIPARRAGRRSKLVALLAALAVVASACAHGDDPNSRNLKLGDADQPRHFFVLPLNLAIEPPSDVSPVLDDMFGAIAGYIRSRGNTIETYSRREATAQWEASIAEVQQSKALKKNFDSAMRVFVTQLAKAHSFDAVIAPSLVYRKTKVRERSVKWDGVFRKMKIINLSDEAKKKGLARSMSIDIVGVSLHVMVMDPSGNVIFQNYGGLDLAHDVDMTNAEFTMAPKLAVRKDLLKDGEHLDEGIALAFDPFLPKR